MTKKVGNVIVDNIEGIKDDEEAKWAVGALMEIWHHSCEIINPRLDAFNALWEGKDCWDQSYEDAYNAMSNDVQEAMSYIYGVNPETKRIVKFDYPSVEFKLLDNYKTGDVTLYGHIEDFDM